MSRYKGIEIVRASFRDTAVLARLHQQYIHLGFLSSLGRRFLSLLYQGLLAMEGGILITAKTRGRIIGFISGVDSVKAFYRFFVRHYWPVLLPVLLFRMLDPRIIWRMAETLLYPGKATRMRVPEAELLSIVVEKEYQSRGAAQMLFSELVRQFKERRCLRFKVVVGSDLKRAVGFYKKMGFKKAGSMRVHRNSLSYVYVYSVRS